MTDNRKAVPAAGRPARKFSTIAAAALCACGASAACTGLYVGRDVSADGSVLLARSVDLTAMTKSARIAVTPRVENSPGRVHKGTSGFSWPLPSTTWKFISTPLLAAEGCGEFASACANEKGLIVTGTVTGHLRPAIARALPPAPNGCAEDNMPSLIAASCADAAGALDLIAAVMAGRGTREPNIYMIADRREAWLVETYTANLWAAMRLPPDKVAAFGNNFILEGYDPKSPDWRAAPEIETAPKSKGLAVYTAEGLLHLYRTYDGPRSFASNIRGWHLRRLIAPGSVAPYADRLEFPLVYRPARKLGAGDLFELLRTRYEGTPWCPDENAREDVRTVGDESQATTHVLSLDPGLPPERSATAWVCHAPTEFSVFLPVANCATAVDAEFSADATNAVRDAFDPSLAADAFRRVAELAQVNRALYGRGVRDFWAAREKELLERWPAVLKRGDVREITGFSAAEQRRAAADARRLAEELMFGIAKNSRSYRWRELAAGPTYTPRTAFEPSSVKAARLAPHPGDPAVKLPPGAGKAVRIAADEFASLWRRVTGRALPTNGVSAAAAEFAVDASLDAAHDEYRILSTADGVRFTGANGRAVIYAVYDFFERRAGCRWFWDGDRVPRRETVPLDGLDVREKARFEYRGLRYFAHRGLTRFQAEHWGPEEWKREIDWCMKRRLNVIMPRIGMDDTWQKAFPDTVPYPSPDDPAPDRLHGYNNRVSFWGLKYRGELRRIFTEYAFDRGMIVPTDFGTMTHWYARTPVEFLEKEKPPFLPQSNNNYSERTGLVWDIFQGPWLDRYWHLTETFINAGYGRADHLHTIGLGERMCFKDRARNLQMKKDVLRKITGRALSRYPDAKILLAGWDFYNTWRPEEVRSLIPSLNPANTIVWDYECDAGPAMDGWLAGCDNNFTKWGLIGKFPYTFGIFLAYEQALDIRAHYDIIEAREKLVAGDPMCKGYIFWPESSHTDILLLRYFTANAWRPGRTHLELLPEFCRDRYGVDAARFESVWRAVLPVSQILGWHLNWGADLVGWTGKYPFGRKLEDDAELLDTVPSIFGELAAIEPADDFARRDAIDLARTAADRALIGLRQRMIAAYDGWADGKTSAHEAARTVGAYRKLAGAATELLSLHNDYSLCISLDRLGAVSPEYARGFDKVLLDNAINGYCRSHQYEIAAGWYQPFAEDVTGEMLRRIAAGERLKIEPGFIAARRSARYNELFAKGIEAYRPRTARSLREYRRILGDAREAAAR
ncbi:MAG: C69 family dipeptidase [Kiritimatiellae bacterium]|nr:C69 family dipeptidase [Kiritimatiellia bacterium]